MGFCAQQLARLEPLWERMVQHPFLVATRDGTLPRRTFANWMQQDYLFVEAAIPFLAALLARAPRHHRQPLAAALAALEAELGLFRERAQAAGIELAEGSPAFIAHAYIQFLHASAARRSYAEAYTVLYAAEKAYLDSWAGVREGIDRASPWFPFVDNWSGESFRSYVGYLGGELDALASEAGPAEREGMAELFETTARYELAFWELAYHGPGWPGLDGRQGAV